MTKDILSCWAGGSHMDPRPNQITALKWLEQQTAKYLIIEAPVGAGKSMIGLSYAEYLTTNSTAPKSFVLTPQIILQKQYEDSVKALDIKLSALYGKNNYVCEQKSTTCNIGSLIQPRCDNCASEKAKNVAKSAENVALSYALALATFSYTDTFDPRKLMILDECHTIEETLCSFDAVTITQWHSNKHDLPFKTQTTLIDALEWIADVYLPPLTAKVDEMIELSDSIKDGGKPSKAEIKVLKDTTLLQSHMDELTTMVLRNHSYVTENFVLIYTPSSIEFKRIHGSYTFENTLKPQADKFLFMSATVLDKDGFCADLGIEAEDTAFLSLPSEFPVANRPIYIIPQMKMNASWKQPDKVDHRKQMISTIKQIILMHGKDSGIIHTANFMISMWLLEKMEGWAKTEGIELIHHNPGSDIDRNTAIDNYTSGTKKRVLISPSITEGLDLKYDQGRFAITVKVPFGQLGDQWIKKRLELSTAWYQRQAIISVIQGSGRVVRTDTDTGSVYILDASFAYLRSQTESILPKWWTEAITYV